MNKFLRSFKKDLVNHAENKYGKERAKEIWAETEKNMSQIFFGNSVHRRQRKFSVAQLVSIACAVRVLRCDGTGFEH